jgi:hypothetical protein
MDSGTAENKNFELHIGKQQNTSLDLCTVFYNKRKQYFGWKI